VRLRPDEAVGVDPLVRHDPRLVNAGSSEVTPTG
jgi:hypothetical protein